MEEFFSHKCVTSDAVPSAELGDSSSCAASPWSQVARCELVVVQEPEGAHGASRAVLAASLAMMLRSRRTSAVLLFTMDSPRLADALPETHKLVHVDYAGDTALFRAALLLQPDGSNALLTRLRRDVAERLALIPPEPASAETESSTSDGAIARMRSVVVVLDSLNVLLEQTSLQKVLLFLRELRQEPRIGSVVVRVNTSAVSGASRQVLASEATAVAQVETPTSLNAYPILAKERRREVPKNMHGFVLLQRLKKNGRSTESIDYFQIDGTRVLFFTAAQAEQKQTTNSDNAATKHSTTNKTNSAGSEKVSTDRSRHPTPSGPSVPEVAALSIASNQTALPVRQDEVSFNLSISVEEQLAKSRVQLPYMHQGQPSATNSSQLGSNASISTTASSNNLFFIDDDDPDWDDDDLDDDLDL